MSKINNFIVFGVLFFSTAVGVGSMYTEVSAITYDDVQHDVIFVPTKPPSNCQGFSLQFESNYRGNISLASKDWWLRDVKFSSPSRFTIEIRNKTRTIIMEGARTGNTMWGTYRELNKCSGFFTHPDIYR